MVQLKVENVYAELQYQRKFQFLMVQLKVFTNGHNLSVKPISIPNGSIKSQNVLHFLKVHNLFQFLMVQLKEQLYCPLQSKLLYFNS